MATDVIMPQMGESIAEGTITKWLKKPGDSVRRDEPLFEISTDKVDAEIPSPASGTLVEIGVEEGQTVEVGTVVAFISGLSKVNDPWGDLVNYMREATVSQVKYRLIASTIEAPPP